MNIPDKVRIGSFDYKVKLIDETILLGNTACYGRIEFDTHTIEINQKLQDSQGLQQTFLHELVHGIVKHFNIKLPQENEEDIVDKMSCGLHQVIRDNPGIF